VVTEVPHQSTSRTKARFTRPYHHYKMRDKITKSSRIDAVVAVIQRGEFVDYSNIAVHYKCSYTAVSRRVRGLTKLKKEANLFWH
jgi:hypothetical protein